MSDWKCQHCNLCIIKIQKDDKFKICPVCNNSGTQILFDNKYQQISNEDFYSSVKNGEKLTKVFVEHFLGDGDGLVVLVGCDVYCVQHIEN